MDNCERSALSWIWASRLSRPINKVISILEEEYGTVENAFEMVHKGEITKGICVKSRLAERLRDPDRIEETKRIYNNAVKKGMRIITRASTVYPVLLREISSSPAVLYCYGKLPCEAEKEKDVNMPLLAVVGARNCSAYGYGTALKFSRILSALGVGIVSGMARGIDTAAHRGTLDSEGYTVAVLGSGADVVYPMENKHLYDRIKHTGCIISEFLPGTEPVRNHFPARNRIIAGMTQAVTVIEAGESSGAMITAGLAGEMGRDVYAVPGNIDSALSFGANKLIQNGALCVMSYNDILEELGITLNENKIADKNSGGRTMTDNDEEAVYSAVKNGCYDMNGIAEKTNIPLGKLRSVLGVLEINGMISRNYDGFYYVNDLKT